MQLAVFDIDSCVEVVAPVVDGPWGKRGVGAEDLIEYGLAVAAYGRGVTFGFEIIDRNGCSGGAQLLRM